MSGYDYVVVGGGSAGCVLANRLSRQHDVLLLEAGDPDEAREISVPIAWVELLGSEYDWGFRTAPQPELNDRSLQFTQGKVVGGSSSINAQIYVRGHPADFDRWASAGNEGWAYGSVRAYYERLEDGEPPACGTGGPQHVVGQADPSPISSAFVDAAVERGIPRRGHAEALAAEGAGHTHVTQKSGERHSAADAFLKPVLDRPRLTVETGAEVREVLFDGSRATGVRYVQDGETARAEATGEVILSAGAINTPKLLLLSGVGPADHLRAHGIEVRVDLPGVGRNLQDHLIAWICYESRTDDTYDDADSWLNVLRYLVLRRGPLTTNGGEASAYWRSESGLDAPDVQFLFAPAHIERNGLGDTGGPAFSIGTSLVSPKSRGRVTLQSADFDDDPVVDPRYLSHEEDLETLVDGVRKATEIAEADALSAYRGDRIFPPEGGESALAEHVRANAVTYYHPVGTCRMGADETAVVDDRLRVRGVEGLRVVDASVVPTIPSGNTNAPTLMIAERAAELIAGGD